VQKWSQGLSRRRPDEYRGRPLTPRALMPYKANEPRRHKIPKARYKIRNWAEYDAALRRRGSLTVWVTPEAIAAWAPAATGRRGRSQSYSDVAIEAGLMLRLAFGRPWRQIKGLLGSILDLRGLDLPVPDHTTFSRRSASLGVATALKKANGPVHVVIDSTGLKVFGAGDWLHEKHGGRPRRSWRKLHVSIACRGRCRGRKLMGLIDRLDDVIAGRPRPPGFGAISPPRISFGQDRKSLRDPRSSRRGSARARSGAAERASVTRWWRRWSATNDTHDGAARSGSA
jgi:hypothetical protein